jgi:autotransporter passenger strand-loop-strand repeat protein
VSNGGTASGTSVSSGGAEIVSSGGVATSVTIVGGVQTVVRGGSANGTVVSSGGSEIVSGTASGTVVDAGGSVVVWSGGTANALILNGGSATVMSGGAISGATISSGTLVISSGGAALSSTVTFAGSGSLVLDDTKFRGKIAGFDSPAETIDLTTVTFGSATTLGYTGNSLSGTLTVTDGTHTARLAMLGQYTAASFHLIDDTHGGTLVFDPPVSSGEPALVPPH